MADQSDLDLGIAGASGRREYERRRGKREAQTREQHPRIGGLLLKLREAPEHEQAWVKGAVGEEELAAALARRCPEAIFLHDRRMPGSRANIDHLAVVPSGVHVIDAKRYKGRIEVRKPFFGEAKLMIGGRDKTRLIAGLERQAEAVRTALTEVVADVRIHRCLCFVGDPAMPVVRRLEIDGVPLLYARRLAKQLNQPGELGDEETRRIVEALARRFPPA